MTLDQAELFPFSTAHSPVKSKFRMWLEATEKHGPLLTPSMAAAAAALHRSRIHQLLNEDRIASVDVGGERYIPLPALEFFLSETRRTGRPTLVEKFDAAFADRRAVRFARAAK